MTTITKKTTLLASPAPTLTNAKAPGGSDMVVSLDDDILLLGTKLDGYTKLVAHHAEYADPIELTLSQAEAMEGGTMIGMSRPIWNDITSKIDASKLHSSTITFDVTTPNGTASISPTIA